MQPQVVARPQIRGVAGRGQLLGRPPAGGEEEVRIALDPQARAVRTGQLRPAHTGPRTVLLRPHIRRLERVHRHRPAADPCGRPGVRIALARPAAEPRRQAQAPAHPHPHSEPRQRNRPVALGIDAQLQSQHVPLCRPAVDRAQRQRGTGRGDPGPYHHGVRAGLDGIDAVPHPVQADPPPLGGRPRPRLPGSGLVVVGRRAPDVQPGAADPDAVQIGQHPRAGIEGPRAEDDHIALTAARCGGGRRGSDGGARCGRQLAPGDLVPGRRPCAVLVQHGPDRPPSSRPCPRSSPSTS